MRGARVRTRSFIFVAAFLAVVVVLGGALYAYDHARANEIAPGVKVGGVALAGLTPDGITVTCEQRRLTLSGERTPQSAENGYHRRERPYGKFSRSIQLPVDLDIDHAEAKFNQGVMTLRIRPIVQYPTRRSSASSKVRKSVERRARTRLRATGVDTIAGVEAAARPRTTARSVPP
jgi:hypothetical protein